MEQVAYIHFWKLNDSKDSYHNEANLITSLDDAVYQYDQQSRTFNDYLYTLRLDHTAQNYGAYEQINILPDVIEARRDQGDWETDELENQSYYVDQALGIKRNGVTPVQAAAE